MRWRLYLEEYSPEIRYIKGESNQAADTLSWLPKMLNALTVIDTPKVSEQMTIEQMSDIFCYKLEKQEMEKSNDSNPITYKDLKLHQQADQVLQKMLSYPASILETKNFHGGGKTYKLIVTKKRSNIKQKICVPKTLQKRTIVWYHEMLCHPGQKRMEETIGQHFWWPQMRQ